MSKPRLLWPTPLARVPEFPAELVGPLAAHGLKTVGDLVAAVQKRNPGMLPPAFALGLNIHWQAYPVTDAKLCCRAGEILNTFLGYREHQRPADWTDPPAGHTPTPNPEPIVSTKPRMLPTASLSLHPQAAIVPEMPEEQYKLFLADVRSRGIMQPIELIPGTKTVIEGRTRLRAATDAGFASVPVVDAEIPDGTPVLYMLRAALLRRHLSPSQAAALAVEVEAELSRVAKERQREGGRKGGEVAGRGRPKSAEQPTTPTPKQPSPGQARDQAAAIAGTNGRYVSDAKRIKAAAPEVFDQVKAGKLNIPAAKRLIKEKETPAKPEPVVVATIKGGPVALKPCPFCGGEMLVTELVSVLVARRGFERHVRCSTCEATGPKLGKYDVAGCQEAWNRRRSIDT